MSTASRVIKNTGYLYVKMFITVFVSLFTTRLILSSLGASDFGIYNVVGGAIAMMGFLNSTLANATQRFMSYSLGEGDEDRCKSVFNISIVLHLIIALVTVLLLLIAMWPLFGGILNIPAERVGSAKVVYLCLVFSTFLTIINVPYDAVMNAHENMLYYSIIGIFEALLKLGIAICCVYTAKDKLVLYGLLMACIPLSTLTIMKAYCHRHYGECVLAPRKYWDKEKAGEILSFSGWNFMTAVTSLFTAQGIGIVLNHYFGTLLNAAQGVANQINGYMSTFSQQLKKAVNPVIVKKAGSGEVESMNKVTISGCKFNTFLILLLAIPCIVEMPYILDVWLKDVPDWAVAFCTLQLIQTIVCQMVASVSTAIYAQGDIKAYAIWKSIMNAAPLFITWLAFGIGGGPVWLYIPMILVWGIGGDIVLLVYARKKCGLPASRFIREAILPILGMAIVMLVLGYIPSLFMDAGIVRLILCVLLTVAGFACSLFLFGMNKDEKSAFVMPLLRRFSRKSVSADEQ